MCGVWLGLFVPSSVQAVASDATLLTSHQAQPEDTIRGLILRYNCVRSMIQYGALREDFRRANPQIQHSGQLALHDVVRVPGKIAARSGACLNADVLQMVRVEFENLGTQEAVRIYMDGPILPEVFLLKREPPHRVVCDFDGALPHPDLQREIFCPGRLIRSIRVGHEDKPFKRARIVLEIDEAVAGHVEQVLFEQQSLFVLTVHEFYAP